MSSNDNPSEENYANNTTNNDLNSVKDTALPTTIENIGPEEKEESDAADGVTMLDVLQDETELEEDARAVLGGADDRNCTYNDSQNDGYMKRQALYACITCSVPNAPNFSPAGVCLACSYACHNDHTLVELYTKRSFRCDCGNSKFPKSNPCKLYENKDVINEKNHYNQNYSGVYCTCHRPYPDEEDPVPDAMIQCVMCEDWLHRRHLEVEGEKPPCDSAFTEMICHLCCERYHNDFLFAYKEFSVHSFGKNDTTEVLDGSTDVSGDLDTSIIKPTDEANKENSPMKSQYESTDQKGENKKMSAPIKCFLTQENIQSLKSSKPTSLFMLDGWREQLCKCSDCINKYKKSALNYLLDIEDTLHHYENKTETRKTSQYEDGLKGLSEMDRSQQIEALHGYNSMKSNLTEYLQKFVDNKRVVREEDIKEFFQQMAGTKKIKVSIPDNCK